jgi:hypothetical protein
MWTPCGALLEIAPRDRLCPAKVALSPSDEGDLRAEQ